MSLVAGAVLAHSYRLLEPIGEGGMGRVWVAEHITLDRRVAVKVMTDEAIADPETRDRFEHEARATAKVNSPHVVRVLDFDFTDDGLPFLVLELLTGETLEERILRTGPLSLDEAMAVLQQTTLALEAAHCCGILHRDIKAENLFLQRSAGPIDLKLVDFGIALNTKADMHITLRPGPIGTPQYMSPEQIMASEVTEQSDLFSLGVCLYYALTGVFPFRGETGAMISVACLRGIFEPPSEVRRGVPAPLDAWFRRALALDPTKRFKSTMEMRQSFASAIARPPRFSRDTPLAIELDLERPTLVRPAKTRFPRALWLTASAALVLCGVFAGTRGALWSPSVPEVAAEGNQTTPPTVIVSPALVAPGPQPAPPEPSHPAMAAARKAPSAPPRPPQHHTVAAPDTDAGAVEIPTDPYGTAEFGSRE